MDIQPVALAALRDGVPPPPARLSRRKRLVAVSVDREGDVAAVLILRRSVGATVWDDVHWVHGRDGWTLIGWGSGGDGSSVELDPRPPVGELGDHVRELGGSSTRSPIRQWGRYLWVRSVHLRLSADVQRLSVSKGRTSRDLPVTGHGHTVAVWSGQTPTLTAYAGDGSVLVRLSPAD